MKATLILILTIFSSILSFGQNEYYVSPTGSNGNDGSQASPWQTIQYGLNQLAEGDVLDVLFGTYHEKIYIPIDNITLRGYGVTIDATGITSQNPIIHIQNKHNIKIETFLLTNNIQNDAQGVLIEGSCSDITVHELDISNIHFSSDPNAPVSETTNAQGIIVLGTDPTTPITNVTLWSIYLHDCRLGYSEGIAVNGNVDGFLIWQCSVSHVTNIGIDVIGHEGTCPVPANDQARNGWIGMCFTDHCVSPYATSGGIYIDGAKKILVERNMSYNNGYGIEIGCENIGTTTDSITVRNNIFFGNDVCGIALGGFDYPSGSGKVMNSIIRNNTCYQNDSTHSGIGELYLSYSENSLIENNIFYTNSQGNLAYAELTQPSLNFDYNNVFYSGGSANLSVDWNGTSYSGFSGFVAGSSTNSNAVFGDPLLSGGTNVPFETPFHNADLTSAAYNTGNPSYIPEANQLDYYGNTRIDNGRVDCGADEYGTTTVGIIENKQSTMLIYPNPAANSIQASSDSPIEEYEIYNMNGEKMVFGSGNNSIDITGLNAGLYFVRIYSENAVSVQKFQKL